MKRDRVFFLSYIAAIANLPSIAAHGILSHREAEAVEHESVANEQVQEIRANKRLPSGVLLHDCANLYLWPRNGMMYRVRDQDVCVVKVNAAVLDIDGAYYSERNAARGTAEFAACRGDFDLIDDKHLYAHSWDDEESRAKTQAEVLVPGLIAPHHIVGVGVRSAADRARIDAFNLGLPVTVNPN